MIGIRREDKNDWERRVPLTPDQVQGLTARGLSFSVQPSRIRAFPDEAYRNAGARVDESFDGCAAVIGIKEMPATVFEHAKAYLFFSHTLKGQPYNMPLLRSVLDRGATLLDYELITDDAGRRLIFFGRHAGYAGMIDGLWALGRRLAAEGATTPFARIEPAWRYDSLREARERIAEVGRELARDGVPASLHPFVCGFTGTGNVSLGAQELFHDLPVRTLQASELATLTRDADPRFVYKVVFDLDERFQRTGGGAVTIAELTEHPERFSNGMQRFLGSLDMLVNGMFWVPALPRLLTIDELVAGRRSGALSRLRVIADIACDVNGAVEATVKATTPDNPVFVYDVGERRARDGVDGDGPVVLAVDNLPAELPRESSGDFGATLLPFVPALASCDWSRPLDGLDLPAELRRAVIAHRGELAPRHRWLKDRLP